ncbi:MAG: hypothetical protein ACFB2Y_04000 [Fulvivirga sp.]
MTSSSKKQLVELLNLITDAYAGNYASVSRDLNKAIYCLHFLAKDEIPPDEIKDLCFALHKLSECFYQEQSEQKMKTIRNSLDNCN